MSEIATISLALTSAATRAGLNIADRHLFGHRKYPVLLGSILNNVVPAIFCTGVVMIIGGLERLPAYLLDVKVFIFAAIAQVIAVLFGYAFREASVSSTLVFSKLSDLFIPIGIFLAVQQFSVHDYFFSIATVLACLPVAIESLRDKKGFRPIMPIVTLALVFQGSVSPLLFYDEVLPLSEWWLLTTALLLWRLVISVGIAGVKFAASPIPDVPTHMTLLDGALIITRACLTISTQLTFVMAVAGETPVLAWPLLNCTPLFAAVGASLFLKEPPTRAETLSCVLIFLVALTKVVL